jgi:hypothetical protein
MTLKFMNKFSEQQIEAIRQAVELAPKNKS